MCDVDNSDLDFSLNLEDVELGLDFPRLVENVPLQTVPHKPKPKQKPLEISSSGGLKIKMHSMLSRLCVEHVDKKIKVVNPSFTYCNICSTTDNVWIVQSRVCSDGKVNLTAVMDRRSSLEDFYNNDRFELCGLCLMELDKYLYTYNRGEPIQL